MFITYGIYAFCTQMDYIVYKYMYMSSSIMCGSNEMGEGERMFPRVGEKR